MGAEIQCQGLLSLHGLPVAMNFFASKNNTGQHQHQKKHLKTLQPVVTISILPKKMSYITTCLTQGHSSCWTGQGHLLHQVFGSRRNPWRNSHTEPPLIPKIPICKGWRKTMGKKSQQIRHLFRRCKDVVFFCLWYVVWLFHVVSGCVFNWMKSMQTIRSSCAVLSQNRTLASLNIQPFNWRSYRVAMAFHVPEDLCLPLGGPLW